MFDFNAPLHYEFYTDKKSRFGKIFSELQNEVTFQGHRLSPTAICRQARIKRKTYESVLAGDNPYVYAYFAVFQVYRSALEKGNKLHLLPGIYDRLQWALEEDFATRCALLRK